MSRAAILAAVLCLWCASCGGNRNESLPPLPDVHALGLDRFEPAIRAQIEQASQVANANPNSAAASGALGMALQAYELNLPARKAYERAQALAVSDYTWAYLSAVAGDSAGLERAEVTGAFRLAWRLKPDYLPAGLRLGELLLAGRDLDQSWRVCESLLARAPESAPVSYLAGRIQESTGNLPEAARHYTRACTLAPRYGSAHYALGLVLQKQGDAEGSRRHLAAFRENEAIGAPVEDPLLDRLDALRTGAAHHLTQGKSLQDSGRTEAAVKEYLAALKINPRLVQAHINLISAYSTLGRMEEAATHYKAALQINPRLGESYYNFGMALSVEKRFAEAENMFRRALEIAPSSADALNNLGYTLERQQQIPEAKAAYRKAVQAEPAHREAHFNLARLLEGEGQLSEAITELTSTLGRDDERTPVFMYYLARALAQTGDYRRALQYCVEARARAASRQQTALLAALDRQLAQVRSHLASSP